MEEIEGVIRRLCRGGVIGLDEILVEFWKNIGRVGLAWLIELFNIMLRWQKCPKSGGL